MCSAEQNTELAAGSKHHEFLFFDLPFSYHYFCCCFLRFAFRKMKTKRPSFQSVVVVVVPLLRTVKHPLFMEPGSEGDDKLVPEIREWL